MLPTSYSLRKRHEYACRFTRPPFRFFILSLFFFCTYAHWLKSQNAGETSIALQHLRNRGEVIIQFLKPVSPSPDELGLRLSLDLIKGDTLRAYANEKQFHWFLKQQIPFQVILPGSPIASKPGERKNTAPDWIFYPSYPDYLNIMERFATAYSHLCLLKEFGTSVSGRKLLALKISDNPAEDETEPSFMYSAAIHGDEATGFNLMLKLADSLLKGYESSTVLKDLIDNTEIWINPLANPDGFYFHADSFSLSSKRFNINHIDLNRNFPDAVRGQHPDGNDLQPENEAIMNFMKEQKIALSANLHDGAEVVNYPWDNRPEFHADDSWYQRIARQFADTVQRYGIPGFFDDENQGITNGYAWYSVYGGRQDFVNYFLHGRETTIELSRNKSPGETELMKLWDYHKNSLIQYIGQIHTGIHGIILDAVTGEPVEAEIAIPGHDKDHSEVLSSGKTGEFYRLLPEGSYSLQVSAGNFETSYYEVFLTEGKVFRDTLYVYPATNESMAYPNPFTREIVLYLPDHQPDSMSITLSDMAGRIIFSSSVPGTEAPLKISGLDHLAPGVYLAKIMQGSLVEEFKMIKVKSP
jgi:hypothetical protein